MRDNPHLLIVEDDAEFRTRLAHAMSERGFRVHQAANLQETRKTLAKGVIITHAVVDLKLSEDNGLDVLTEILGHNQGCRAILLTGFGSISTTVEAMRRGAADVLTKPADARQIARALLQDQAAEFDREPVVPSLARAEWEHMQRVLRECGGNISRAARLLGINRRSLQRKLQKIPPPQ